MLKWIIALVVAVVLGWFLWFQLHTTKISYVNGLEPYTDLPNREYILVTDCYVFAWHRGTTTGFPLLGANLAGTPTALAALPKDFSAANVGKAFPEVRLMDAIPRGTRFKLLSVRREESRQAGTLISYEIKFLDDIDRPYQRVDIRPILLPVAKAGEAPTIDPAIAVPWIKR